MTMTIEHLQMPILILGIRRRPIILCRQRILTAHIARRHEPYVSDSNGRVYDNRGYPVYPYRAAAEGPPVVTAHEKSQVRALATHWTKVTPEKKLYYYDEEQITIDPTDVVLRLKSGHPIDAAGTPLAEAVSGEAKPAYELTDSITLICSATVDGSFTVTNSTPHADLPGERCRAAEGNRFSCY